GTSCRCGGGFAKQVAANVEKCEAPTLLWERLEIRLDENLNGLFAGINLDTNGRVAKVDLVASSVLSSNNGVGHHRLGLNGSGRWTHRGQGRNDLRLGSRDLKRRSLIRFGFGGVARRRTLLIEVDIFLRMS